MSFYGGEIDVGRGALMISHYEPNTVVILTSYLEGAGEGRWYSQTHTFFSAEKQRGFSRIYSDFSYLLYIKNVLICILLEH
jgi:hypothetical protein